MKLLFLCTQNACRSQMAEHWARHLLGSRCQAASAGTRPAVPNPRMLQVMQDAGVDVSGARSKSIDELGAVDWDLVVTLCDSAAEACPTVPAARRLIHHPFEDPAHAQGSEVEIRKAFERVRDQIREFVVGLPELLR